MIGRCTWVDYTVDDELGLTARASFRMEDGSRENLFVLGTEPYIFVPEHGGVPPENYISRIESGYESLFDQPLKKVVTEKPNQAKNMIDKFSWTGEGDVPYYRKLSIHDGLSGYVEFDRNSISQNVISIDDINTEIEYNREIEPRISISDIEVHIGDDSFDYMKENGTEPINVICSYDTYEEDYSVFYYDKYNNLNLNEIRGKMEDQLEGTSIEDYGDVEIGIYSSESEVEMLQSFIDYCNDRDFDLISGWNFINFDYEYIINRMETLNSEGKDIHHSWLSPFGTSISTSNNQMKICGFPSFDMMRAFCDKLTFSNWRSKSLEYVSNEELGIGKIDDVDINNDWKNNPSKLIAYNIVDVILTVALDDVNDIHNSFYELADDCSIPIYDTFYEKRLVDGYVMSRRKNDEVLPTTESTELLDNAGGYVEQAVNGRFNNIGVSDLKSLYPSAMITWNISTETVSESPDEFDEYVKIPKVPEPKNVKGKIIEDQIKWDWLYASLDEQGLIPRTLKKLFEKRNHEKSQRNSFEPDSKEYAMWDRKQASTKIVMNSFYGNASSKYWRLSNEYLGDAITSSARYTLWKGKQTIEKLDYEGIYGDTDSHFIQLKEDDLEDQIEELKMVSEEMDKDASDILYDIHKDGEDVNKHPLLIDSELHGDHKTCMKWEPEKLYETWMQLSKKKRYAGNIIWKEGKYYDEGKISISGFENQRSDSMEITAELQKKVIEMILKDGSFEDVSEYIRSIIDQIDEDNPNISNFALPGSINKDLEDYPNRQIPRGSIYSNENLGYDFREGDDPFVYLVSDVPSGLPNTDVVALEWDDDFLEGFSLDKEAIIERGIKKPIDVIIKEVGWEFNELRSGKKQQTMDFGGGNPFG